MSLSLIHNPLPSISQRIEQFSRARPPGIYKEDYIQALFDAYHERRPEEVSCPSTPEWKRAFDLDLDLNVALNAVDDDGVGEGEGLVQGKEGKEVSDWICIAVHCCAMILVDRLA